MTAQTQTLTDFLLACIAEDKAEATEQLDGSHHTWDPARVLAECEAKRRIVKRIAPEPWLMVTGTARLVWRHDSEETLRDLAQPYADRAGFREEWRA